VIYFVKDSAEDAIKIGFTKDIATLEKRMKTFACANSSDLRIMHLEEGDRRKEARLHREWGNLRKSAKNEWFRNAGTLALYLDRAAKQPN
jgi:hypothetical protein